MNTIMLLVLGMLVLILYVPLFMYLLMVYPCYCYSKNGGAKRIRRIGGACYKYFMHKTKMIPSHRLRMFMYRHILNTHLDKNVVIYFGTEIRSANKLYIGKGSIVGDHCILDARNGISIGRNVNLSSEVHIWTEQHDYRSPSFACYGTKDMGVKICDYAWIGSNTIILPKVTIGEGAVVCAGAVVTKDVPPFSVVAGVPAKTVAERPRHLEYRFDGGHSRFY